MRWVRPLVSVALVSGVLLGCASIQNAPVNLPGSDNLAENGNIGFGETASFDDTIVGLSFSGGGTRAAAFSRRAEGDGADPAARRWQGPMIDRVEFISGVSGGSVTAAYYGLRKRAVSLIFANASCCAMRRRACRQA
jgi:NTE family protein